MKVKWDVDDRTVVDAELGLLSGKELVRVNGRAVVSRRNLWRKGDIAFPLPGGRQGAIGVKAQLFAPLAVELRIDGRLFAETTKEKLACGSCGTSVKPNDRFCDACGHAQPTAEERGHHRGIKAATSAIRTVAVLFVAGGLLMFFVLRSQSSAALAQLAGMDPTAEVTIGSEAFRVSDLRQQLEFEPWGLLATNVVLAAIMAGLAFWSKRSPLPAVLVATATYAAVIVANAILDPQTIGQGLPMKLIMIAFFVKGIKAALALRASATTALH